MIELQETAELAAKYINTTNRHIFLTGKAGTGKTTFLKYIIDHTYKNTVVAAPTGIAAINAGGVTLHSLLQLPFGTFLPDNSTLSSFGTQINTPQTLFRESKFNTTKRKLIQELELLIIDEVSMLRADLLDCIDHTLRYLRKKKHLPFGGLQILFIGDLMQLPPVVKDQEAQLLKSYYTSNYFFEAQALQEQPPIRVELKKIFRQSDQDFIDLLNRLRNNEQTNDDIHWLNRYYNPDFNQAEESGYIHLTTHNYRADKLNQSKLQSLESPLHTFY
ncbi:MAG: AAA family ATPase, partial [Bacteroidota bacterium]